MAPPPLATAADLAARMATTVPPERADAALADASATVRAYTGQTFTQATTSELLRPFCCVTIRLPQRPVNDVLDVSVWGDPVGFSWDGSDRVQLDAPYDSADVLYDHGYAADAIPADVVSIVCNIAARSLGAAPEDAGVMTRSITNYSETFGPVSAAGPAGMFNDEKTTLDRYRRPGASARVCAS
jgi:hypothetical protein